MGGGILLLGMMTFFLPYQLLVPIHGAVQLVSNSSRTFYLRKNIRMDFFIPFILGAPFGYLIAYNILKEITDYNIFYLVLALFVIYAVFKPKKLPEIRIAGYQWSILGLLAGFQGALIGAVGPLLAPFYLRSDITKEELIATKAAQQIFIHIFKIPLFLSLDFNYIEHAPLLLLMSFSALIGSFGGVKLLKKLDEKLFKKLFKSVLLLAAVRLLYKFWVGL